jgi:poly(hydroxyalkanoate) depolymerase family esterase
MRTLPFISCALSLIVIAPAARAGNPTAVTNFGSNPASLSMEDYVPQSMPTTPRPLVVALHGCTQTADTYVAAGWDNLADEWKFYVVYPGQNTTKNNSLGCFNWGGRWKDAPNDFPISSEPLDLTTIERGNGENESIKQMVDYMKANFAVDGSRVFVTGLSAGGAMTALLLAVWPDVFAAGAIFAGIPYGCAMNPATTNQANSCMRSGYTQSPQVWGDLVRHAYSGYSGPYPRVSIWQGSADYVVSTVNQGELVKQWTDVHGTSQTPSSTDMVDGFPHAVFKDAQGVAVVETYSITGQGHGTDVASNQPVDPANPSGEKCGQASSYILDDGICSTYYAAKFFGLDEGSPAQPDGGGGGSGPDAAAGSSGSGGGSNTAGSGGGAGSGGDGTGSGENSSSSGGSGSSGGNTATSGGGYGSFGSCALSATTKANDPMGLASFGVAIALAARRRRAKERMGR